MYFSPFPTGFDVQLITSVYPFFKVLHCKVIVKTPVVDVPQEYLGNESIPPAAWSFLETDKVNYLATIKDRPAYLQNRHVHSEPSFSKKVHMSAAVFFFCSQPALHTDECSSDCVDQLWVSSHELHSWEFGEFGIQKLAGDGKE